MKNDPFQTSMVVNFSLLLLALIVIGFNLCYLLLYRPLLNDYQQLSQDYEVLSDNNYEALLEEWKQLSQQLHLLENKLDSTISKQKND